MWTHQSQNHSQIFWETITASVSVDLILYCVMDNYITGYRPGLDLTGIAKLMGYY